VPPCAPTFGSVVVPAGPSRVPVQRAPLAQW